MGSAVDEGRNAAQPTRTQQAVHALLCHRTGSEPERRGVELVDSQAIGERKKLTP
jgi:hypothetical protein